MRAAWVQGGDFPIAVDDDGRFTAKVADFQGRYVKEADKDILAAVKASTPPPARTSFKPGHAAASTRVP